MCIIFLKNDISKLFEHSTKMSDIVEKINKSLTEKINILLEINELQSKSIAKLVDILSKEKTEKNTGKEEKEEKEERKEITDEFLIDYLKKNIFAGDNFYFCRCPDELVPRFFEFFVKMGCQNGYTNIGELYCGYISYENGIMVFENNETSVLKKLKILEING